MKAYGIFPLIEIAGDNDLQVGKCVSMISDLVCRSLRAGGDTFHVAIDWRDPNGKAWSICTEGVAQPHIVQLRSNDELLDLVRQSSDPFSGRGAHIIRSMATCRAATFGYDGQVFLCLRHEDSVPTSPDPKLIEVVERPELLSDADYFDGIIVSPLNSSSSG